MKIIQRKFLYFIFLLNLVYSKYENITLKEQVISINKLTEPKKYRIISETVPLFLQIISQGNFQPNTSNINNYIISYYANDSNFKERKQLSKSFQGKTVMWLNNEQIKNEFYISIECEIPPCDYSLSIIQKKIMDLSLNEKYTYFITEENKKSRFTLDIIPPKQLNISESNYVQIWAKGSRNLVTNLEGVKHEKLTNYNGYIVNLENTDHFRITFDIEAKIGDLVTIGVILFENGISYMYSNISLEDIFEIDTLLKREIAEKTCYKMPKTEYKKFYNLNYLLERDIDLYTHSISDDMICGELLPYLIEDFYSIQYTLRNRRHLNIYNPIIQGPQYNAYIFQGESVAVVPMTPEEDFNYLNYYMYTIGMKKDVYIYDCESYPFCDFDRKNLKKISQIESYYSSYSYSYSKKELDANLNPINLKQKILIFTCKNGVERRGDYYCLVLINMYTDRTKIQFGQIFNQYRFIREGSEDNFIIDKKVFKSSKEEHGYLNIETISGNISVFPFVEKTEYYAKDNKKLYIINKNLDEFSFKITAQENSVYYLNYYGVRDNIFGEIQFYGMHNGNYLLKAKKDGNIHLQIYTLPSEISVTETYQVYTSFTPLGCTIDNVYNSFQNFTDCFKSYLSPIPKLYGFYQYIYKGSDFEFGEFNQDGFYVNKTGNPQSICLFYSSFFILSNYIGDSGINLEENIPRRVVFTKKNYEFNFTFALTDINKDVNIKINLLNNTGKYNTTIYIKNYKLKKSVIFKKSTTITLTSDMWDDICTNNNQICRIYLDVISQINKSNKFFEIIVNTIGLK